MSVAEKPTARMSVLILAELMPGHRLDGHIQRQLIGERRATHIIEIFVGRALRAAWRGEDDVFDPTRPSTASLPA